MLPLAAPSPNAFQRWIQRLAATRPASWLLARLLRPADCWLLASSRDRLSLTSLLTGLPVVILTTRGARSGQPRSVPLMPLIDGEAVILVASAFGSQRHPAWYYNLTADPRALLSLNGHSAPYLARQATEEESRRYWAMAVAAYPGYAGYRQRSRGRSIPVLVLTPQPATSDPGSAPGGSP